MPVLSRSISAAHADEPGWPVRGTVALVQSQGSERLPRRARHQCGLRFQLIRRFATDQVITSTPLLTVAAVNRGAATTTEAAAPRCNSNSASKMSLTVVELGHGKTTPIDPLVVKRAQMTAAVTTSVESLRQCQALLLPALFGPPSNKPPPSGRWPCDRAAPPGGLPQAPVGGVNPARNWGGRRKSSSPKRRSRVLKTVAGKCCHGHWVVVSPLRAALAQRLANRSSRR